MTILQALFLGLIQGLTEFFPVSSSGHLVLTESWFGLEVESATLQGFDVLLHAGTAVALLLCYRSTWQRILLAPITRDRASLQLVGYLVIATIPGAAAGLLWDDYIAQNLRNPVAVAWCFLGTASILVLTAAIRRRSESTTVRGQHAVLMGLLQACALLPGVSRSGLTASAGQWGGLSRQAALDFSFLMAMPIILGATAMTLLDYHVGEVTLPPLSVSITGFLASLLTSFFAVMWLRHFVAKRSLAWFAVYLVPLALAIIFSGKI